MDYSTAVCDAEGNILAQGLTTPLHLGSFFDAMKNLIRVQGDDIDEGDLFIFNDPYLAAGQHLPDIYVVRPIFVEGGSRAGRRRWRTRTMSAASCRGATRSGRSTSSRRGCGCRS
jgi:N-methylhydantoinase B/oxoprolinase/acetone carboxylase alpha subunit